METIAHNITLTVGKDISKANLKDWFNSVKSSCPKGVLCTHQVDGKAVQLVKRYQDGVFSYIVPLTRDLTDSEVSNVVDNFSHDCDCDFKITATFSPIVSKVNTDVIVEHDPLINLCTEWAKSKHQEWKKAKEQDGWRYGPIVSKTNKTHPLLRDWDDIPPEYRKVNTKQVQEVMDLLKSSGYILVHHEDLDLLMGE
jgi:hypothetical protein